MAALVALISRAKTSFVASGLLVYVPIYFFLALINLRLKLLLTPAWFDGTLARNHALLLSFQYTNNEQSRLLQYYGPEIVRQVFQLSIEQAYIVQRFTFVFLAFVCFHWYLAKWFDSAGAFAGVLFLAAVMPLSYINDLQESAPLLLVTFLLGLWAIRERKEETLVAVLLVGGLNNETMLLLLPIYVFVNYRASGIEGALRVAYRTFLIGVPLLLTVGTIRYLTRERPHLDGVWHLTENLEGIWRGLRTPIIDTWQASYLYIFFLFNVCWIYALLKYDEKPLFLRRAGWTVPFFIAGHLVVGKIEEVRQLLPLAYMIVPMALFYGLPISARRWPGPPSS
jgi:hypothetical protein